MDVGEMLDRLRDPLGAPFYPPVFQVLLVVTWVLHIFFVTLALGSGSYAIYGFVAKGDYRLRLARGAAQLTTNAVGLGIVTGIAPLLFIQTIYDPIWYASNSLTGFWSVIFVFVVMGGYGLAYLFYLKGSPDGRLLWSAVLSTALIFFAGWIMHVLASVSIRPDEWREWYAPDGIIDTRGIEFHAFNVPRLVFLLPLQGGLSLAVVLRLYAWYHAKRDDADADFLAWVGGLGRRLGMVVAPLYALAGVGWALTEGREFDMALPVGIILTALGLGLFAYFTRSRDPIAAAPKALLAWAGSLAVVAVVREAIRAEALSKFDYSVGEYPYILDWGSVLVFAVTSVAGVSVIAYLILVIYQAGLHSEGGPISMRVDRWGRIATGMLGAWFGFFLLVGLYTVFLLG